MNLEYPFLFNRNTSREFGRNSGRGGRGRDRNAGAAASVPGMISSGAGRSAAGASGWLRAAHTARASAARSSAFEPSRCPANATAQGAAFATTTQA